MLLGKFFVESEEGLGVINFGESCEETIVKRKFRMCEIKGKDFFKKSRIINETVGVGRKEKFGTLVDFVASVAVLVA